MAVFERIISKLSDIVFGKDKTMVVMDSWFGNKFADNPRFLFQYLSNNKRELGLTRVVWVTHKPEIKKQLEMMGYEVYILGTPESKDVHKKAYYHICNNAPSAYESYLGELDSEYSFGSKRINLWHGTGVIKNFNKASNEYLNKEKAHPFICGVKNYILLHFTIIRKLHGEKGGWGDCYFLTTSESELQKFKKCYRLPDNRFIVSGYPRDSFEAVKLLSEEEKIIDLVSQYDTSIMYLPTFRDQDDGFDFLEISEKLKPILKKKIFFLYKKHIRLIR